MPTLRWTVGDVVRKLRDSRDWDQQDLARVARLNKSAIVRLEKESDRSKQPTVAKVAAAFGLSVPELHELIPVQVSSSERKLLRDFSDLPREDQQRVLAEIGAHWQEEGSPNVRPALTPKVVSRVESVGSSSPTRRVRGSR